MSERRVGFHVDRTVTLEGPFKRHPIKDAVWAHATVETQGVTYRVAVTITDSARRYLVERRLRNAFDPRGTPIRWSLRGKKATLSERSLGQPE